MIKFLSKIGLYVVLITLVLEIIVRIFHLHNDKPVRFVDSNNINKWVPGQTGYCVYGNRVQNKAAYRINASGFNSYREFEPSEDKIEIALIGDSFIEGFHQNYDNSIGNKMEQKLGGSIEVYEFGHSSNDFADQLYLIYKNRELFSKIDHYVFYLRYNEDLDRSEYKYIQRQPMFMGLRKRSKFLEYSINIGLTDAIKNMIAAVRNFGKDKKKAIDLKLTDVDSLQFRQNNFDKLLKKYDFNTTKSAILLDSRVTPTHFLKHLERLEIRTIDFSTPFEVSGGKTTTLIYDQHWNDFGRELIADELIKHAVAQVPVLE